MENQIKRQRVDYLIENKEKMIVLFENVEVTITCLEIKFLNYSAENPNNLHLLVLQLVFEDSSIP